MISKYTPIIIGSLLLLVTGLMYSLFQSNKLPEDEFSTTNPADYTISDEFETRPDLEVTTLRGDLSLLREQFALLQQQLQDMSIQNRKTDITPDSNVTNNMQVNKEEMSDDVQEYTQKMSDEERREAARLAMEKQIATLENKLYAEEEDIAWSTEVESRIYDAIEAIESTNTSIIGVECRSTMCKLEVASGEGMDTSEFRAGLIPRIGDILPQGTMRVVDQEGGQKKLEFYMARDGYNLADSSE